MALSPELETILASLINEMAKWNHPINRKQIQILVKNILDNQNIKIPRFKNNIPKARWIRGFCVRNKISKRRATNIKRARAAITENTVNEFFDNLSVSLSMLYPDITNLPTHIFNYDETNLTNDPQKAEVLARRGHGRLELRMDHSKTSRLNDVLWFS